MDPADIDLTDLDRFIHGFPHEAFVRLRREAPVWFHPPTAHTPGGEGFWVLSRYAEIAAAASDAATFSSESGGAREGGGTILEDLPAGFCTGVLLNMMDDSRHRRIRNLVTPSVAPRALRTMEPELRERTRAIVEAALARGDCDFLVDVAAELPLQAIARLMGVPQEDRHKLIAWADATLDYDERELGQQSEKTRGASAVEEMLRWASSTPYNRRTATREVTVGGKTIGAGDKVTLWWASANRDEAVFPEPFRFDVRRDPNPHLSFGHGTHFCLGAALARMEMRLVFEALLEHVAEIRSAGPVEWTRSSKHTGVRHMPVTLKGYG